VPPLSHLTSCTPTKRNLHLDRSLETVSREPALSKLLTFRNRNLMSVFHRLGHLSWESVQVQGSLMTLVRNLFFFTVKGCQPHTQPPIWRTTPCRLSAAAYSIYSQLPSIPGGLSFIRNPRTRHAVVTGNPQTHNGNHVITRVRSTHYTRCRNYLRFREGRTSIQT
jgi:hypothetical protein